MPVRQPYRRLLLTYHDTNGAVPKGSQKVLRWREWILRGISDRATRFLLVARREHQCEELGALVNPRSHRTG